MSKKIKLTLIRLNKFIHTQIHKKILILTIMENTNKKFMTRSNMLSMSIKQKLKRMMLRCISLKLNR